MAQSWFRTHPLRWLKRFLNLAIRPFTEARSLKTYATRGYILLGILSLIVAWPLLNLVFAALPINLQNGFNSFFESLGIKNDRLVPFLSWLFVYLTIFLIRPLRYFIGEWTANGFFGAVDCAIRTGEWCMEHRWWSLAIVILLTCVISGGMYHLFEEYRQDERMKTAFNTWYRQAAKFVYYARVTEDQGLEYREDVNSLWNADYEHFIDSSHPTFSLRKMLHSIHGQPVPETHKNWYEFLKSKRDELKGYTSEYIPHDKMNTGERDAWALMNIFMGRFYARLGDTSVRAGEPPEVKRGWLVSARDSFSQIDQSFAQDYQDAAHNGLGTVYADVLTPPLRKSIALTDEMNEICGLGTSPERCANLAFGEYLKVQGETCSYQGRRRENNIVDLLARVGINYVGSAVDINQIHLGEVCGQVGDATSLSSCIERRVNTVMKCVAKAPFLWAHLITTAEAYAASTELMKNTAPPAETRARATATGRYLRLAYAFSDGAQRPDLQGMKFWPLCYFHFATENTEFAQAFWQGFESPTLVENMATLPDPLPIPKMEALKNLILKEQCRKN